MSCNSSKPQDIRGKWYLYGTIKNGKTKIFNYKKYIEYDGCTKKHYIQFNGTTFIQAKIDFHSCEEEHTLHGVYKINKNNITLVNKTENFFEGDSLPIDNAEAYILSFSIKENKLILKNNSIDIVYVKSNSK